MEPCEVNRLRRIDRARFAHEDPIVWPGMRSWEYIVDRDFDVTQFGDVLEQGHGKGKA